MSAHHHLELPGPIATYVGANHVGAGALDTVVPGEPIELSFGTDDGIAVERQLVSRNQETLGRRATRWTFHYRVVARNLDKAARVVQVLDQVPVSEFDKVEVRVLHITGARRPGRPGARGGTPRGPGGARW